MKTKNIYLAAALVALGFKVKSVDKRNGTIYWTFEDDEMLQKTKLDFINGSLMVPAKDYANMIKILKTA